MKKENPKIRWHVTAEEKKQIRRMTRKGVRQSQIARALGIGAPSVSAAQKSMNLPTRLVIPEKRIMALFEKGFGGHRISKLLHVPANQVYATARKNSFRRADGAGDPSPKGNVAGFIKAVKRSENYIKVLAKKIWSGILSGTENRARGPGLPRIPPRIGLAATIVQLSAETLRSENGAACFRVRALTGRAWRWNSARSNYKQRICPDCRSHLRTYAAVWKRIRRAGYRRDASLPYARDP